MAALRRIWVYSQDYTQTRWDFQNTHRLQFPRAIPSEVQEMHRRDPLVLVCWCSAMRPVHFEAITGWQASCARVHADVLHRMGACTGTVPGGKRTKTARLSVPLHPSHSGLRINDLVVCTKCFRCSTSIAQAPPWFRAPCDPVDHGDPPHDLTFKEDGVHCPCGFTHLFSTNWSRVRGRLQQACPGQHRRALAGGPSPTEDQPGGAALEVLDESRPAIPWELSVAGEAPTPPLATMPNEEPLQLTSTETMEPEDDPPPKRHQSGVSQPRGTCTFSNRRLKRQALGIRSESESVRKRRGGDGSDRRSSPTAGPAVGQSEVVRACSGGPPSGGPVDWRSTPGGKRKAPAGAARNVKGKTAHE
mmetsp:Transcript_4120/g.8799  ORF Transcript_4120/g.8799 Transcript_4120/m.8799 type:complete len:360 (+) Transcript_4120:474-1553(+)